MMIISVSGWVPRGELAERLAKASTGYQPILLRQVIDLEQVRAAYTDGATGPISDSHIMERAAKVAAQEVRSQAAATIGLALVGTSGQSEGVFGETSGETWLAIATEDRLEGEQVRFGGQDDYTIVRIANQALRALWKFVR